MPQLQFWARTAALLLTSPLALSQGSVVYLDLDPATGTGDLCAVDTATGVVSPQAPEFQGLRFLPFDESGRIALFDGGSTRPRWHGDVPGAGRLELQQQAGSLYRYYRENPSGSRTFGFLHLDVDGSWQRLLERPGVGPAANFDPYIARVGVAPDGHSVLVATRQWAGGDLFELDLETGTATLRTSNLHPQLLTRGGLRLTDTLGIAITRRGILRFNRDATSQVELVPIQGLPLPRYYQGDVVLSQNREWAVTVAGENADLAHALVFSAQGPAVRVTDQPARLSAAGFAPEYAHGPFHAVSDDGAFCAWRVEIMDPMGTPVSRELMLGRVPMPSQAGMPSELLTGDSRYLDTLDEVGQAFFVRPDQLVFAVGEIDTDPTGMGIEGLDWFRAEPSLLTPPGSPSTLTNISLSSGTLTEPFFTRPEIDPLSVSYLEDLDRFVFFDDGDGEAISFVDITGNATTVLQGVKDAFLLEATNGGFLFSVRRTDSAGGDYELWRAPRDFSSPPQFIAGAALPVQFDRLTIRRDGWVSFIESSASLGQSERLWRVRLQNGATQTLDVLAGVGPTMTFTSGGALAFSSWSSPGSNAGFFSWRLGQSSATPLTSIVGDGFILPAD